MAQPFDLNEVSVFKPLGYQNNNCGYCKKKNQNPSYYATSTHVRPDHYQELINRGWRRSGNIYYKPDLPRSCCPHYTIRLNAEDFKPRKDQRRAVNRWNDYILGKDYIRKAVRLCPQTREEKHRRRNIFDLSHELHRCEYENVKRPIDPTTKKPLEPAHKFEVNLEADSSSEAKWKLFAAYQSTVHKEPAAKHTRKMFERFLCSGLKRSTVTEHGRTKRLGSYHQCYRIDGKLVAVAVLDLLPQAVSAVYIFYDPDFEEYEFGKLSALREIALSLDEGYKFYYMGYYIHTCVKMKYKANFRPQQILDPESLEWGPLDSELAAILDKKRYYSRSGHQKEQQQLGNSTTSDDMIKTFEDPLPPPSLPTNEPDPKDPETEDEEDEPEIPDVSLFTLNLPGVMTKEEVLSQIDLGHWKLLIRGKTIDLEDLRSWGTTEITDSQTIKGIAAELAATLGPKVVQGSVMLLFD